MEKDNIKSIEEYIAKFPLDVQEKLTDLRNTIKSTAPEAMEKISYQMPAYELYGILVYFAGFKKHIGFYPTASGIEAFKSELRAYKQGKGSVQFPLDKPIPYALVAQIVKFKAAENTQKHQLRNTKRST